MEKEFSSMYNENYYCFNERNQYGQVYRNLEQITCSKRYTGTTNPKQFQSVLDFFRSEYKSMNFESKAEKTSSEIFIKKSFVVKQR